MPAQNSESVFTFDFLIADVGLLLGSAWNVVRFRLLQCGALGTVAQFQSMLHSCRDTWIRGGAGAQKLTAHARNLRTAPMKRASQSCWTSLIFERLKV